MNHLFELVANSLAHFPNSPPDQELEAMLPHSSLKDAVAVRALPHRDLLGWIGAAR